MSGYKIVLPGTFNNAELPVLRDDPVLSAGSLLLVEPGNPTVPYSGSLRDGDLLPNLAWREALALCGGTETTLASRLEVADPGRIWRTGKGGIQWRTGARVGAHFPLPVLEYMRANPTHDYRAMFWGGLTDGTAGVNGRWSVVHFDPAEHVDSIFYDMHASRTGNVDATGADIANTNTARGIRRYSVGGNTNKGPVTATAAQADSWSRIFGFGIGTNPGPAGGQAIFHRFYLEDVTVSGRAASVTDALDKEFYIRHELKAGGRYFGESFADRP